MTALATNVATEVAAKAPSTGPAKTGNRSPKILAMIAAMIAYLGDAFAKDAEAFDDSAAEKAHAAWVKIEARRLFGPAYDPSADKKTALKASIVQTILSKLLGAHVKTVVDQNKKSQYSREMFACSIVPLLDDFEDTIAAINAEAPNIRAILLEMVERGSGIGTNVNGQNYRMDDVAAIVCDFKPTNTMKKHTGAAVFGSCPVTGKNAEGTAITLSEAVLARAK